jgi:hypothetical protein
MIYRLLFFLIRLPLCSVASGAVVALAATGQNVFYPIEVSQRGTEIVNTFNSLNSLSPISGVNYPEIILQTSLPNSNTYGPYRYITNGRIPFVQSLTSTTHKTLLIVTYLPPKAPTRAQYIVVPVEQMTELVYVPKKYNEPTSNTSFTSTFSNIYPYFSVNSRERAADIVSAVNQLKTSGSFQRISQTQIWIQTNISGPFNPEIPNGLLKNVTSISVDNSLVRINFLPPNLYEQTVLVAPEQVVQVLFIYNYSNPGS